MAPAAWKEFDFPPPSHSHSLPPPSNSCVALHEHEVSEAPIAHQSHRPDTSCKLCVRTNGARKQAWCCQIGPDFPAQSGNTGCSRQGSGPTWQHCSEWRMSAGPLHRARVYLLVIARPISGGALGSSRRVTGSHLRPATGIPDSGLCHRKSPDTCNGKSYNLG